jgi:hypothetical protein
VQIKQSSYGEQKMLTKIVLATALAIGTASVALASSDNMDEGGGGFRVLGSGGVVTDGVNPVYHRSLRAPGSNAYGYAPEHTKQGQK